MRLLLVGAALVVLLLPQSAAAKGEGPTSIAVGGGGVWVGFGDGTVRRIDPRAGSVGAPLRLGDFVHDVEAAFGSLWVATGEHRLASVAPDGRVTAIDLGTRRAWLVESGRGRLWVGDYDRSEVYEIDPRRRRVVRSLPVPDRLMSLAAGGAGVWALVVPPGHSFTGPAGPRFFVVRLDAPAGRWRFPCEQALAVGRSVVWAFDPCDAALRSLRPSRRGRAKARFSTPVLAFGSIWLVGPRVTRLDPSTLRATAVVRVRGHAAAAGFGALWVLNVGDGIVGSVARIDARTNLAGRPIRVGP